jgi:tetratricopeptide (TPR) repeat protein
VLGYNYLVVAERDRYKIEMRAGAPELILLNCDAWDGTGAEVAVEHYHETKQPVAVAAWSSHLSLDQLKEALPVELRVVALLSAPLDPAELARLLLGRVPPPEPIAAQAALADLAKDTVSEGPRLEAPEGNWDLRQCSPARLFAGAGLSRWTGRLSVESGASRIGFWFENGNLVHAQSAEGRDALTTLDRQGKLPANKVPDLPLRSVEEQLGLLYSLRILGMHEGDKLRQETIVRLAQEVLFADRGQAVGSVGERPPERVNGARPAISVAIGAARALASGAAGRGLDAHPESVIVVRLPSREMVASWGLGVEERKVLDALDRARGRDIVLDQFLRVVSADGQARVDARGLLAFLRGIGMVDFRGRPWDKETDEQLEKLVLEIHRVARSSVFEAIGLDMNATDNEIREKFRALARTWHPDAYFGKHPRVIKAAEVLFGRLQGAYDQIKTPQGREAARSQLAGAAAAAAEKGRDPTQARVSISQGKLFLRNKRYPEARQSFRDATVLDPSNAEAHVLYGWARYLTEPSASAAAIRAVEAGARLDPKHADAAYYLGRIASLQQDPERALKWFQKAIALKPDHTDAVREVRVLENRLKEAKGGAFEASLGKALGIFQRKRDG